MTNHTCESCTMYIALLFQERHAAKTVGEIKQFVSKLPHMQNAKSSLATRMSETLGFALCLSDLIMSVNLLSLFLDCSGHVGHIFMQLQALCTNQWSKWLCQFDSVSLGPQETLVMLQQEHVLQLVCGYVWIYNTGYM